MSGTGSVGTAGPVPELKALKALTALIALNCMGQASPTSPPASDLAITPLTDVERELVRNLLRGVRRLAKRGFEVRYDWCKVRRSPHAKAATMTIEIDPATFDDA